VRAIEITTKPTHLALLSSLFLQQLISPVIQHTQAYMLHLHGDQTVSHPQLSDIQIHRNPQYWRVRYSRGTAVSEYSDILFK
jgi:hypothetical protein